MEYSKCPQCKQTKPLTAEYFSRDSSKSRGFSESCKPCRNSLRRACRARKKEKKRLDSMPINPVEPVVYIPRPVKIDRSIDRWMRFMT